MFMRKNKIAPWSAACQLQVLKKENKTTQTDLHVGIKKKNPLFAIFIH